MLVALSVLYYSDICIYYFVSRSSCRDMKCLIRNACDAYMCMYAMLVMMFV
jgi:hypothetical protein